MKNIKIWYLDHSSFAVKVKNKVLVFDYHNDREFGGKKGFEGGVVRPEELKGLDVFVFVSHSHDDHYNPIIHSWEKEAHKITYIFSSDVIPKDTHKVHLVEPHMEYDFHGLHIKTLLSNDMGVAFYVTVEDLHFFHSGDLNWWRWPQESKEWNNDMEKIYKEEMKTLKDLPIDFAFIPADPRMGDNYLLSLRYFIDKIRSDECLIFPMHFGDNWKVFDSLKNDGYLDDDIIIPIAHRGQKFEVYK